MDDLKLIKKHYGEKMMHLCRELFPNILEEEGKLFSILDSNFDHYKGLYEDIKNSGIYAFKKFIYNIYDNNYVEFKTDKSAKELMDEAGYNLYECKTEEDIQKFKKYYYKDEEKNEQLCTFRGGRLDTDYVFFAVKKNVDEIVRKNFGNPERQDEYGTSVISVQFSKYDGSLSIKNRYNHTVRNPDATFSNNLENIIPGLTNAFIKDYKIKIRSNSYDFDLCDYRQASNGKFYKTYMEINNICYGPNNVIIDDGKLSEEYRDKSRYLVLDRYIIDMSEKTIYLYDKIESDSFVDIYNNFTKLEIEKKENYREIKLYFKEKQVIIKVNEDNQIIGLIDNNITKLEDNFCYYNETISELQILKVQEIGNNCFYCNLDLTKMNLPNVKKIGSGFCHQNQKITNFYAPLLKRVGDNFLKRNLLLTKVYFENLVYIGDDFVYLNINIKEIYLPKAKIIGNYFMVHNDGVLNINLPRVEQIGRSFLYNNVVLKHIFVPCLKYAGNSFLFCNKEMEYAYFPELLSVGEDFIGTNRLLNIFVAPKLREVGSQFFYKNNGLEYLCLDELRKIGPYFCYNNEKLETFIAPNLLSVAYAFFMFNEKLKYIEIPKESVEVTPNFLNYHNNKNEIIEAIMDNGVWDKEGYSKILRKL